MDWRELYFSSRGRISRRQYWLASLPLLGVQIVAEILIRPGLLMLGALLYLAIVIPSCVLTIKRLHDRDRSGWFLLLAAIPFLGLIWLLIEAGLLAGARGPNRFGPDPLEARAGGAASAGAPV
jgi:uncharacterized membrane protein YhaH (DUF805 family)